MATEAHGFRRLLLLIEQLRDEDTAALGATDPKRGWPGRVAERLGISKELVQKISSGERAGVQSSTIDTVCATLKIDRAFFADEDVSEPDHREYLRSWEPPEFLEFKKTYARINDLSPNELVRIKRMKFRNGQSAKNFAAQADLILGGGGAPLRQEETEAKAAAEGVQRVARKRR